MPLYEFKCEKCGKITEDLVKFDTESIKCSECGRKFYQNIISNKLGYTW